MSDLSGAGKTTPSLSVSDRLSVDVIVCARDVETYIFDCLQSMAEASEILDLRIKAFEDGSSDKTLAEIRRFAATYIDINIEIFETAANGVAAVRNMALDMVSDAQFICFVDGDDLISSEGLVETSYIANAMKADIVCPQVTAFDDITLSRFLHDRSDLRHRILSDQAICVTNARDTPELLALETSMCMRFFRRSFLIEADVKFSSLRMCEDVHPSRRAFLKATRIVLYERPYYYYRLNRVDQRTSKADGASNDIVVALRLSIEEGMREILDNSQGAWLLDKLVSHARWGAGFASPEELLQYASSVTDMFERVPIAWWHHCGQVHVTPATKDIAYLYSHRSSRLSRERIIFNPRFRFADRALRRFRRGR